MELFKTSRLQFYDDWPALKMKHALALYDQKLTRLTPHFKKWRAQFDHALALRSGEDLKQLSSFSAFLEKTARMPLSRHNSTVLSVGGGSIGDFVGFFASIYHRGLQLHHVPSTWLAAIDSAHGGKTALNVGTAKNQLGTFYPAEAVHLIRPLLELQGPELERQARAELLKIAVIDGGAWTKKLSSEPAPLWSMLKPAIKAKMKVVALDPFEKSGVREILNLGHTWGHVIEKQTGLSHGEAVAHGLRFAVRWSAEKNLLPRRDFTRIDELMTAWRLDQKPIPPLPKGQVGRLLSRDKKSRSAKDLTFLFIHGWGDVRRQTVSHAEILTELHRQGLVR